MSCYIKIFFWGKYISFFNSDTCTVPVELCNPQASYCLLTINYNFKYRGVDKKHTLFIEDNHTNKFVMKTKPQELQFVDTLLVYCVF